MQSLQTSESPETAAAPGSLSSELRSIGLLVWIYLMNFLSRIIFAPLMPSIEQDLKLGHDAAGSLFFMISLGFCVMLLGSGFVSSRLDHRRTLILSSMAVGGALWMVALSHDLGQIRFALLLLGMATGLYLSSGMSTLTSLVNPKNWGKAMAIHELAPNLSYVIAPFLAEVTLTWFSWRGVLFQLGGFSVLAGIVFLFFGKGGGVWIRGG
jgi:NNP family nitrate/nitrite transporter-like MFS transporter